MACGLVSERPQAMEDQPRQVEVHAAIKRTLRNSISLNEQDSSYDSGVATKPNGDSCSRSSIADLQQPWGDMNTQQLLERDGSGQPIVVAGLCKSYDTAAGTLEVLSDLDLEIEPGEFTSLVGPSGCGKSTLLKIIAGLIPFDSGTILVGGAPPLEGRRDVGFMLQQTTLMPWRSVRENVRLPFELSGQKGRAVDRRVETLLELVGLGHAMDMRPTELSGGMQQRVALARLLSLNPKVMLLDEPFSALDEFKREHLGIETAAMHEDMRKTTVMVTHSIPEAVMMSDRIVCLGDTPGRVLATVDVDLPRPRNASMIGTDSFQSAAASVRAALAGVDGGLA